MKEEEKLEEMPMSETLEDFYSNLEAYGAAKMDTELYIKLTESPNEEDQ